MQIDIQVQLSIDGTVVERNGKFQVDYKSFQRNPNYESAKAAHRWIREIKMETGFRDTEIIKVIYDGEQKITDLVKEIDKAPF